MKVFPRLDALSKEGEAGRRTINRYTRYSTVLICVVQSTLLVTQWWSPVGSGYEGQYIVTGPESGFVLRFLQILCLTTGSVFLMWLGEKNTEVGIGNGTSLLIMVGIIAAMPAARGGQIEGSYNAPADVKPILIVQGVILICLYLGVVAGVGFITKGQRRIPVQQQRSIRGKRVYGGQRSYMASIFKNDVVIGIGPAGTGKTYLGVACAVDALYKKRVRRIILARPAVEAGENLGFLPGDLQEKVDPYLRPLYDALEDMMPQDRVRRALEDSTIEIAPLAYMRGRTLSDAFVILDEAQNATRAQMKMFLTRLGMNSRVVITGDKTQIDLPNRSDSGLLEVEAILSDVDGISLVYLDEKDVIRHRLVKDIIRAYERDPSLDSEA